MTTGYIIQDKVVIVWEYINETRFTYSSWYLRLSSFIKMLYLIQAKLTLLGFSSDRIEEAFDMDFLVFAFLKEHNHKDIKFGKAFILMLLKWIILKKRINKIKK